MTRTLRIKGEEVVLPDAEPPFQWRLQYDEPRDQIERDLAAVAPSGIDLAQQQFKDDTDLNLVLKRHGLTDGPIPPPRTLEEMSATQNFGDGLTLRQVLDIARGAKERFMALPAATRNRFRNDPSLLAEAIIEAETNPKRAAELAELGLLKRVDEPDTRPETVRKADELARWVEANGGEAARLGIKKPAPEAPAKTP